MSGPKMPQREIAPLGLNATLPVPPRIGMSQLPQMTMPGMDGMLQQQMQQAPQMNFGRQPQGAGADNPLLALLQAFGGGRM